MKVDIVFSNATVYNVDKKVDVVKGEKFSLVTDSTVPIRWFTDNDPVLNLVVDKEQNNIANIEATEIGQSTMLIMSNGTEVQKTLEFNVIDRPQVEVINLNPTVTEILPK